MQRRRLSITASPSRPLCLPPQPLRKKPRLSRRMTPSRVAPAGGRGASAAANKNSGLRDEKTARAKPGGFVLSKVELGRVVVKPNQRAAPGHIRFGAHGG